MPGEALHALGEDGVRRAKKWLEATTRVSQSWTVYDDLSVERLEYTWPHGGQTFSYDLGGMLWGGEFHRHGFLAECKKYTWDNQGAPFDKFLAQSYVTRRDFGGLAQQFMWITWTPFRVKAWRILANADRVEKALVKHGREVFNLEDETAIRAEIDAALVADVVSRVWVIVLSDQQEKLVISKEDRAELMKMRIEKEES